MNGARRSFFFSNLFKLARKEATATKSRRSRGRVPLARKHLLLYLYTFIQATHHTGSSVYGPGAKAIPQESIHHRLISQRGPTGLIGHLVENHLVPRGR